MGRGSYPQRAGVCSGSGTGLLEDFLGAGLSALSLLVIHLYPSGWLLSTVALVPFLLALSHCDWRRGARLGLLLGLCYFTVSETSFWPVLIISAGLRVVIGSLLMALFGAVTGYLRSHHRFNIVFVALLWVGVELLLIKSGLNHSITSADNIGPLHFQSLSALFGFLNVAFLLLVINGLVAWAVREFISCRPVRIGLRPDAHHLPLFEDIAFFSFWFYYLLPEGRAPPLDSDICITCGNRNQ